jgi:hypothetical protein
MTLVGLVGKGCGPGPRLTVNPRPSPVNLNADPALGGSGRGLEFGRGPLVAFASQSGKFLQIKLSAAFAVMSGSGSGQCPRVLESEAD